jgi:DNA repair protein RecN (Recombination protein N)
VNRQFVNGSPTTLNVLAAIGEWLADIHGPHEHQSLLQPAKQLALLDAFGGLETPRESFADLVRRVEALEVEKKAWVTDEKTHAQQIDLLRFQTTEIANARLDPGEEAELVAQFQRASNAAKLLQLSRAVLDILNENDSSVVTQARIIGRTLQELHRVDGSSSHLVSLHGQAVSALQELSAAVGDYAEKIDIDPARLEQLEERLNLLHSLKRKYGGSVAEIIAHGEQAAARLGQLEQRDSELVRLNKEIENLNAHIVCAGQDLSAKRRKLIPQLTKAVTLHLAELGFRQSQFEVMLASRKQVEDAQPVAHSLQGFDTVEFQFAPNPGEAPRPLRAIASSGELARVMLAIKTVLASQDQVPLLVFDEVDANVGGETANAVAEKIRQIAQKRQVLCITHLPQVAAPASAHYVATKEIKAGRTVSNITLLQPNERVTELARMLGGGSDAARRHAKALLSV